MGMLVVGTGALACLFAAKLAGAGHAVTMLGSWPDGLAALRKHGVKVHDLDGNIRKYAVEVLDGSNCGGNYREALVLVKSWQTTRVAAQLRQCLPGDGVALTLQNGLGNYEVLSESLGADRVALGVTMLGARLLEPGHVQFTGSGKVYLGVHPRLDVLKQVLEISGFQVDLISDPMSLLWGKLVINASINPLTALLRVPNGELLERPSARELLASAAREVTEVAARQGIALPYADPVQAVEDVARGTALNYSSMLQDVLRGTPTEIESINGAIVRIGERLGVEVPTNRVLWQLVSSIETSD